MPPLQRGHRLSWTLSCALFVAPSIPIPIPTPFPCHSDYNTVESVLLACAVLVNLAGIMFNSKLLDQPQFHGQRDFIAYATIFVIVFSIVYVVVCC